jgi:hypothetical protein
LVRAAPFLFDAFVALAAFLTAFFTAFFPAAFFAAAFFAVGMVGVTIAA